MLGDRSVIPLPNARRFKDSKTPLATLFQPYLHGAKEIIVGNVHDRASAVAATNLADLVAVGRHSLIDPHFAEKLLEGQDDQIVSEISIDQARKVKMTPGLIDVYSGPKAPVPLPGAKSLRPLHQGYGGWREIRYHRNDEVK